LPLFSRLWVEVVLFDFENRRRNYRAVVGIQRGERTRDSLHICPRQRFDRFATVRQPMRATRAWHQFAMPRRQHIQPRLATINVSKLASALGVSKPYAADIRAGRRLPHERHWVTLAKLTGFSGPT
jgi:hypothetical protein